MKVATAPYVLVPQHFGGLVFDRAGVRYLPFDHAGFELLVRSLDEPIDSILGSSSGEARSAAEAFFARYYAQGLYDWRGFFAGVLLEVEDVPQAHLLGPLVAHLEVIAACNLSCTHCFAGELPRAGRPLSQEELDPVFAQLAALGCFCLNLTGGEPLLRRDLVEVIDLAGRHGLFCTLTSNGLLIDEPLARAIGQRENLRLNLSLEGASEATHDAVRGSGSFSALLERISLLREHARFALAFTVTAHNAHEVDELVQLSRRLGADALVVRPTYPVGEALHHPELVPSLAAYSEAVRSLAARGVEDRAAELCGLDPRPPQAGLEIPANAGCSAGRLQCSISATGAVNPCSFLGADYDAGTLREASFGELWRESQRFRELRDVAGRVNGCRARALHLGGALDGPDPWEAAWQDDPNSAPPLGTLLVRARARPLPRAEGGPWTVG